MNINSQPSDLVFFWGTGFLSSAIRLFEHGGPSHCAIILDPSFVVDDGAGMGGPYIAESTIQDRIDGVQVNSLPLRVASYDVGGTIALARLSPRIRALMDFPKMWKLFYDRVNIDHYEKLELLEYVARNIPLIDRIPQYNNPHREVCSELTAMLLAAGGVPGLNPFRTGPHKLYELSIYGSLDWIAGKPRSTDKFNSV